MRGSFCATLTLTLSREREYRQKYPSFGIPHSAFEFSGCPQTTLPLRQIARPLLFLGGGKYSGTKRSLPTFGLIVHREANP